MINILKYHKNFKSSIDTYYELQLKKTFNSVISE